MRPKVLGCGANDSNRVVIRRSSTWFFDADDVTNLPGAAEFRVAQANINFVRIVPPVDI